MRVQRLLTLSLVLAAARASAGDTFQCPPGAEDLGEQPGQIVRWCTVEKDGRPLYHGPVWRWYRNGQLAAKENYVYGAAEGDTVSWNEDGTMASRGVFKGGMKTGLWSYWDEHGRLATEVTYGESGNQRADYYPAGSKKATGVFVSSGKIGKWTYWNADGSERARCDLGNGVFAVSTAPCRIIADELEPKGFSPPVPSSSLDAGGVCSLRIASQRYTFRTPSGWVGDAKAGKSDGAPLVFFPVGGSWRGDNSNLYVRVLFKDGASFDKVLQQEAEDTQENVAEYSEKALTRDRLKGGRAVVFRTITYKSVIETDSPFSIVSDNTRHERLAYVDASSEIVLLVVLTSPSEDDAKAAAGSFDAFVRSLTAGTN